MGGLSTPFHAEPLKCIISPTSDLTRPSAMGRAFGKVVGKGVEAIQSSKAEFSQTMTKLDPFAAQDLHSSEDELQSDETEDALPQRATIHRILTSKMDEAVIELRKTSRDLLELSQGGVGDISAVTAHFSRAQDLTSKFQKQLFHAKLKWQAVAQGKNTRGLRFRVYKIVENLCGPDKHVQRGNGTRRGGQGACLGRGGWEVGICQFFPETAPREPTLLQPVI